MKISYYPGCTLKTKAKDLDVYTRLSAAALGIEMEEIENWQCCGAVYPMARDEIATKLSAVRALDYAKHHGGKLLTLCSACHNVIKRTNEDMRSDKDISSRANNYLALGCVEAIHAAGLHIPADIGVMTFDDYPFSQQTSPPLTTVDIDVRDMGSQAADLLLSVMRHPNKQVQMYITTSNLIERETTAPVNRRD